jgi:hypothetical protein
MTDTTAVGGRFEIGRVISRTFEVIGRNFGAFALLALLLGGLPSLLMTVSQLSLAGDETALFKPATAGLWILGVLVMLVCAFTLQAAIVHATVTDLNGRRVVVGESLMVGLRNVLPLIGLAILSGLGVGLGILLLIVPGVILALMWSVTVPAMIVERTGVMQAFSRSNDLTRDRRWAIFGLFVIYVILSWIVQLAITAVCAAFAGSLGFIPIASGAEGLVGNLQRAQVVAAPIIGTITALVSAAGVAALYYELRSTREGVGAEALASVFE